jgi:hypothetical protein
MGKETMGVLLQLRNGANNFATNRQTENGGTITLAEELTTMYLDGLMSSI